MKYLDKLNKLAAKFEIKYAQEYNQTQNGTTELFFGSTDNQQKFATTVQSPEGAVAKTLVSYSVKSNQPAGFSLKISAEPNKGASWLLSVTPNSLTQSVNNLLNQEFKKIMNQNMSEKLASANLAAKAGNGSGLLNVASLDIEA